MRQQEEMILGVGRAHTGTRSIDEGSRCGWGDGGDFGGGGFMEYVRQAGSSGEMIWCAYSVSVNKSCGVS